MASWRNCQASLTLVEAINRKYPNRDKSSDGTIGDAAHAARTSDHNPWVKDSKGQGVVRARDVDKDGIDAPWIVEELRKLGASGDNRLRNKGYVIFNRRITTPDFSGWKVYKGTNPHDKHFHVSFSVDQAGYDNSAGWAFLGGGTAPAAPAPAAGGRPTLRRGDSGKAVTDLQNALTKGYPAYNKYTPNGVFGPATEAGVKEFQKRSGLVADGIVGAKTWAKLGL